MPPEMMNLFLQIPLVGIVLWVVLHLNRESRLERDAWRTEIREIQREHRQEMAAIIERQENLIRGNTQVLARVLDRLGAADA